MCSSKKGFTLIELLAVISILAILIIIALPNIIKMFNEARKGTFETEVKTIYKQAKTDYIFKNESGEKNIVIQKLKK